MCTTELYRIEFTSFARDNLSTPMREMTTSRPFYVTTFGEWKIPVHAV